MKPQAGESLLKKGADANMKKRTKITIGVFAAALTLWLVMFSVDFHRCQNLQTPVFAVQKSLENGISEYIGAGYAATVETGKGASPDEEDIIIRSELRIFGKTVSGAIV